MTSYVRCSTRDGLATSGSDYEAHSEKIVFKPGDRQAQFTVQVRAEGAGFHFDCFCDGDFLYRFSILRIWSGKSCSRLY